MLNMIVVSCFVCSLESFDIVPAKGMHFSRESSARVKDDYERCERNSQADAVV